MTQLSDRYAKALLDGRSTSEVEEIQNDLLKFEQLYCQVPQLQHLINGAMISQLNFKKMVVEAAQNLQLSQTVIQFIKLLIRNRRLNKLSSFIQDFKKYINRLNNVKVIDASSRYPLSDKDLSKLSKHMQKILNHHIKINNKIEPSIIAGLRLAYDCYYFDGTINQQITNLEQTLRKLSYGT